MTTKKKKTANETAIANNFQLTNDAAKEVISSINRLRRTLSGQFITPEIDKELKAAIKTMQSIRDNSTEQKANSYLNHLRNN